VQVLNGAPSSAHWNVAPASELKEKLALAEVVVPVGPAVIVTLGGVVSIVQLRLAAGPVPAVLVAFTWNVCDPSARPV
jgi:hypothetical protein